MKENLLRYLDFNLFEVQNLIAITLSGRLIEKYCNTEKLERYPEEHADLGGTELIVLMSTISYKAIIELSHN